MTPKRRRLWLIVSLCVLVSILSLGAWIGWRVLETSSMACECEDPVDWDRFGAWNPVRNRAPEAAADQVFRDVQAGKCRSIPAYSEYCDREYRFKIVSWKLTGRSSVGGGVSLRYWVIRAQAGGDLFGDPVWIGLDRNGRSWKVTGVSLYY